MYNVYCMFTYCIYKKINFVKLMKIKMRRGALQGICRQIHCKKQNKFFFIIQFKNKLQTAVYNLQILRTIIFFNIISSLKIILNLIKFQN